MRRTSGLLVPGFRKRFSPRRTDGVTSWLGVPIGRFQVVHRADGAVELRYARWPVVDVLDRAPVNGASATTTAAGFVSLPFGHRVRFCRFTLAAVAAD